MKRFPSQSPSGGKAVTGTVDGGTEIRPALGFFIALALLLVGAVALIAQAMVRNDLRSARQAQVEEVTREAALLASRLKTEINSAFYLVAGLASYVSMKDELTQKEFVRICRSMFATKLGLVNLAAAEGYVNRFVYPVEGNEEAIGLDYRDFPEQLAEVERLLRTGEPVIAGPFDLVQGGRAIIGRFPVFDGPPGPGFQASGMVSTPMRTAVLFERAGLRQAESELALALRGKDGKGADGAVFYGDAGLFEGHSVLFPVEMVGGSWQLAAKPVGGWTRQSPYRGWIYGIALLVIALFLTLIVLAALHVRRIEQARASEAVARRMKERFFANMSHEIRTPLNGICGVAELIEETAEDESTRESALIIRESAYSLTELLSDVLALTEMETRHGAPSVEAVDLEALLKEVTAPLKPELERKGLEFDCSEVPESLREIETDPVLLRQILFQLLGNAVKFTRQGRVGLEIESAEGGLVARVVDTGIGIGESYLGHIFEAFSQEDESLTRDFYGAGVGLSIVKRAVERLNGRISVKSRKGEGSSFEVILPPVRRLATGSVSQK